MKFFDFLIKAYSKISISLYLLSIFFDKTLKKTIINLINRINFLKVKKCFISLKEKMAVLDSSIITNLENQCKALPEGKEKQVIVRKISEDLYVHMQEIVTKNWCKITWDKEKNRIIISKPKESEEDLLSGLDDLWNWPVEKPDWMKKEEKEIAKKEKEVKKIERLALMNPTREFWLFARDFDKYFDKWKYDDLITRAEQVKKAIKYPVDTRTYNLWIQVYKMHIIPKIKSKLKETNNIKIKDKLKKLLNIINYIINNTKTKNIWLA